MNTKLILIAVGSVLLSSCNSYASSPIAISATPSDITSIPLSTCMDLRKQGLPAGSLSDTHILYKGFTKDDSSQLWLLSTGNGKLEALNNYPQASGNVGFLEDGHHFVLTDNYNIWLGDINEASPSKVEEVSLNDQLLANFRPYSLIWTDIVSVADPNPPSNEFDYFIGRFHSPDNKKVAIWKRNDAALLLMDQSTKQITKVVPTGLQDTISGTWTADSQWFIFGYTHGNPDKYYSQLLKVSSDGTELRSLTSPFDQSAIESPVISPDGKKVVFWLEQGAYQSLGLLQLDNDKLDIYKLEPGSYFYIFGDRTVWSLDSQWFAFILENNNFDEEIHITNIGSAETYCILPSPPLKDISMDWR